MLRIYTSKIKDSGAKLYATYQDGNLYLRCGNEKPQTFCIKELEKNEIYKIGKDHDGFYPTPIKVQDMPGDSYMERFRMYVSENGDVLLETIRDIDEKSECETVEVDKDFKLRKAIYSLYPEYRKKGNKTREHFRLVDELNANTSLAVIDSQLELVTSLLLSIIDKDEKLLPPEKKEVYTRLAESFASNNLMQIKSLSSMFYEITENKKRIRDIQAEYYKHK